jgi:hypothetical protein
MPVQINELIIRANIVEQSDKEKQADAKAPGPGDSNKADIVKECVEMVLEILHDKNQR